MRAADLERHRAEYLDRGLTLVEELVPPKLVASWVEAARDVQSHGIVVDAKAVGAAGDRGGVYKHTILDGYLTSQVMPGLLGWYAANVALMSAVTCEDAILSPYPQSMVNVKLYPSPGGQQGWHYDTNTLTGLLFLTTEHDEGAFAYRDLQGVEGRIFPVAGALLIAQGRRVEHAVEPMTSHDGRVRITVPLNYYTVTDQDRPAGMDEALYGSSVGMGSGDPIGRTSQLRRGARQWIGG